MHLNNHLTDISNIYILVGYFVVNMRSHWRVLRLTLASL